VRAFVVLIIHNRNYIKKHTINNLKTHQPKVTTNAVTDYANYSRFLRDRCVVTCRNESRPERMLTAVCLLFVYAIGTSGAPI
jgi:hypothetical protein